MTVDEAKAYLRINFEKGATCPCCGQLVKRYSRPFHATMALTLIRLYQLCSKENDYYHVKQIVRGISDTGTNDFSKLRYYGLVIEKPKDANDTKTRTSGFWTITDKGRDFVEGRISVPQRLVLYNKKSLGFEGKEIFIKQALGEKFDYDQLMKGEYDGTRKTATAYAPPSRVDQTTPSTGG